MYVRVGLRGRWLRQRARAPMEIVHLDSLGCHATGPIVAAVRYLRYYLAREYHARKVRYPPKAYYGMYVCVAKINRGLKSLMRYANRRTE